MKAALEAAALMEERLEGFETILKGVQENVDLVRKECATKGDLDAAEQRARDAQQHFAGTLKEKADLEQVNQCVQAVRHELTEVVKRKANSEVVESGLQSIREELVRQQAVIDEIAGLKAVIDQVRQQAHDQAQAVRSELSKIVKEQVDEVRQHVQEQVKAVRSELSEMVQDSVRTARTEVAQVQEQVHAARKESAEALGSKADMAVVDERVQALRKDLDVKADLPQVNNQVQIAQRELLDALGSKVDKEKLEQIEQSVKAMQQEFTEALSEKADRSDLSFKVDKTQVDERLEAVQHRLEQSLDSKMDKQQVELQLQHVSDVLGAKAGREQVEDLEQKLAQMSSSKADKEMVEAYVSTSAQGLESRLAHIESSKVDKETVEGYVASVQNLSCSVAQVASCKDTVDGCVANVQSLEASLAQIASSKVDTDKVVELVEAVRDEVTDMVRRTESNSEQVERKLPVLDVVEQKLHVLEQLDLNNLDHRTDEKIELRLQSVRQEMLDVVVSKADEHAAVAKEELSKLVRRKIDDELYDHRMQSIQSQATTALESGAGTERPSTAESLGGESAVARDWVETLMEQRMRLVRTELTKLVDVKADTESMHACVKAATQEIKTHVDSRVDAAQLQLSVQVGQLAQQQDSLTRRFQQVEQQVHSIRAASIPATPEQPKQALSAPMDFDDWKTQRVRQLLTQLCDQSGA